MNFRCLSGTISHFRLHVNVPIQSQASDVGEFPDEESKRITRGNFIMDIFVFFAVFERQLEVGTVAAIEDNTTPVAFYDCVQNRPVKIISLLQQKKKA